MYQYVQVQDKVSAVTIAFTKLIGGLLLLVGFTTIEYIIIRRQVECEE